MKNEQLDSRFLFPNPLLPLGEFLMKFSEQSLFPVSVRSLEQGHRLQDMKIIMHNDASAEVRGFKNNSMVDMTIPEILDTLNLEPYLKEEEMKAIEENDRTAIENNLQNTHIQVTLDKIGFVRIFQRIVTPLSGYNRKPIAISTTSLELTQYVNLLHLLHLYKSHYSRVDLKYSDALTKFSNYLKLEHYFVELLSFGEITTLLAMVSDARHKQTADLISTFNQKSCTPKTVATYVSTIREKLKPSFSIHEVLKNLRNHHQLQFKN